jgi:hypothetical protein
MDKRLMSVFDMSSVANAVKLAPARILAIVLFFKDGLDSLLAPYLILFPALRGLSSRLLKNLVLNDFLDVCGANKMVRWVVIRAA